VHIRKWFRSTHILMIVLLAFGPLALVVPAHAEDKPVTITFALPGFWAEIWANAVIEEFEAQHPDIRVKLINSDAGHGSFQGGEDVTKYLDAMAEYASTADVLYVNSFSLSATAVQAGNFLDLAPLTSADSELDEEDFYPAAWQSFQWDNGVWALPISLDAVVMLYNPQAFDDAGLTYPSPNWTLSELVIAIRTLTRFDADDKLQMPALQADGSMLAVLLRSLLGRGLYDPATTPNAPLLTGTDIESILTEWAQLQHDGYLGMPENASMDYSAIPMRIELATYSLASYGEGIPPENNVAGSLLPGGKSGLYVEGVAISSGTRYPDQAYEFIKFLSKSPRASNSFFSARPARQSLVGAESQTSGSDENTFVFSVNFSPEANALLDEAIANALPVAEMRYSEYLPSVASKITTDNLSVADALQEVESKAQNDYQAALERRNTPVTVAAPPPDVALAPGEIALKFGLAYMVQPLPNQAQWDQVIADFAASNPVVGHIQLDTRLMDVSLGSMAEQYDCFFLPFNGVPGGELDKLLNLDPFMDADANFDRNDVYPNVLAQLQQETRTWAFPLVIQPKVLRYNSDLFNQAGVPLPENGWTVSEFIDALTALQPLTNTAPFVPQGLDSSSYLMLIAAFGGLPFDYRTTPPTINFTQPETVDAIRQVLDLARNGYIKYEALALSSVTSVISIGRSGTEAIYDTDMSVLFYRPSDSSQPDPYHIVTYPTGTQYTPVSYDIGAAYISANAQNPEACYAWISQLAQRPDLITGIPVRHSLLNDPLVTGVLNPDMLNLALQMDQTLSRPDLVFVPSSIIGGDIQSLILRFLSENWLNHAFDNYVRNSADLETELTHAQQFVLDFQGCTAAIPSQDSADMNDETYVQQVIDCAMAVDPSLSSILTP
jgi:ABC-type glycerol-3-phosphate transport system substrate-binding protein